VHLMGKYWYLQPAELEVYDTPYLIRLDWEYIVSYVSPGENVFLVATLAPQAPTLTSDPTS
jgi:hypothetical protein